MVTTRVARVLVRRRTWSTVQVGGIGHPYRLCRDAPGAWSRLRSRRDGEHPGASFTDGQTITVTGTGFPRLFHSYPRDSRSSSARIPTVLSPTCPRTPASGCDGTSCEREPDQHRHHWCIQYPYGISALSSTEIRNIDCDATDVCVLWVGRGLQRSEFLSGPHAFSSPFEISPFDHHDHDEHHNHDDTDDHDRGHHDHDRGHHDHDRGHHDHDRGQPRPRRRRTDHDHDDEGRRPRPRTTTTTDTDNHDDDDVGPTTTTTTTPTTTTTTWTGVESYWDEP